MKLEQLIEKLDIISMTADPETEISGICHDSREAGPGSLFVAIAGFESDGHRFIPAAVKNGAAAVLCQTPPEDGTPYIRVADTRRALAHVSRAFYGYPDEKMTMIAVTGTNGKTTSTMLIKHLLEDCGARVGLIGTNCNMIGSEEIPTERTTPESCDLHRLFRQMLDAGCTHVVMEVSSHSLVLSRVEGIRFAVGVFTNLTQDHLDFHGTMEEYARAKSLLFSHTDKAVINLDDEYSQFMLDRAKCPVLTFSAEKNEADIVAKDIRLLPDRVRFCAVSTGEIGRVDLGIPGRFSVYNALGVIGCCMCLGEMLEQCCTSLSTARGVKGRVETVPTDGDYTILIDYAHTPDALENVLRTVRETSRGRVVALFGCGGDRDRKKRPIMGRIGTELADLAIITSDNPRTERPEAIIDDIVAGISVKPDRYKVIVDRPEAIRWAIENHRPGDVIVLAGKGHETYQEVDHVKHHMDEREIVAAILEKRKNK